MWCGGGGRRWVGGGGGMGCEVQPLFHIFWPFLAHFSAPYHATDAVCAMLYFVPVLIGCRLVLAIRCCARSMSASPTPLTTPLPPPSRLPPPSLPPPRTQPAIRRCARFTSAGTRTAAAQSGRGGSVRWSATSTWSATSAGRLARAVSHSSRGRRAAATTTTPPVFSVAGALF